MWDAVRTFLENQAEDFGKCARGFLGPNAGFGILSRASGSSSFLSLSSKRVEVVSPEQVPWTNPLTDNEVQLPGYFAAAVVAAMDATAPRHISMTKKRIPTFNQFRGSQLISEAQKNRLASSGIMVLHNRDLGLAIRHSLTTSLGNPANQEPSIVRTLDFLSTDFRESFENVMESNDLQSDEITQVSIRTGTEQRLDVHVLGGTIRDWESVSVTVHPSDVRRFLVKGRVMPRYPLNNIDFEFSIP